MQAGCWAGLGALIVDDPLRAQQAATNRLRAFGVDGLPDSRNCRGDGASVAIVVLPCLVLSPLWVVAVSGEIAAWRLQMDGYHPPEHFDPLMEALLHVGESHGISRSRLGELSAVGGTGCGWSSLASWAGRTFCFHRGSISCLQSFDVRAFAKTQLDGVTRARVMVMAGLTVLGYV